MTEREKIAQIIAEYMCPLGKVHKLLWGAGKVCYSRQNFAECDKVCDCADALIAAQIGDVSELKNHRLIAEYSLIPEDGNSYVLPNTPLRVKQLYSGEEVENIVKERNELKVELRDKVDYIHEQDEVIKEYKHRAEVAERALLLACANVVKDEKDDVDIELLVRVVYDKYLKQAEKELAEEGKGE